MRNPWILTLALTALALPTAEAQTVTLERKLAKGTRIETEEHRVNNYTLIVQDRNNKVGRVVESKVNQRYTEEVRSARPEMLWREYTESLQTRGKPKEKLEPLPTSLHGQRVFVSAHEMKPDGAFKIAQDDRERMRLDRLFVALLPPQEVVKVRDSWTVPAERLVRSALGPDSVSVDKGSTAKVTLKSVKTVKGTQIASLKVKLRLATQKRANSAGVDLNLKGEFKWAVEEGLLLEAKLTGPAKYSLLGKQRETYETKGTLNYSLRTKILEARGEHDDEARQQGAPPPPGTRVLICEFKPGEHQIRLDKSPACMLCGKALDKDKACPNGDPFPFQFCPQDGAPLKPE